MRVEIRFSGPIRRPWPEAARVVELRDGTRVGEALRGLGFAAHELRFLQTAVDGEGVGRAHELHDGDRLEVMLRVGGG